MNDFERTIEKYKSNPYCFEIMKHLNTVCPQMRFFIDTCTLYNQGMHYGIFYIDECVDEESVRNVLLNIEKEYPTISESMTTIYLSKLAEEPGIAMPNLFEVFPNSE